MVALTLGSETLKPVPGSLCPVMVNRKAELEELERLFDQADGGRPSAVFIEGEAGIGKSRLFRSLIDVVGRRPAVLITFQAAEQDMCVPLAPLRHGLRTLLRRMRAEGANVQEVFGPSTALLAPLMPELRGLVTDASAATYLQPVGDGTSTEGAIRQRQLFDALLETFVGLAALDRPSLGDGRSRVVLLCFEDLHWADEPTLDFVRYLGQSCIRPPFADASFSVPIMLVCTYRTEYMAQRVPLFQLVRTFAEQRLVTLVRLSPLSESDHLRLIEEVLGGEVDPALAARLYSHSEGNPFVAEELISSGLSSGLLREVAERWVQVHDGGPNLPLTLRAAVLERLAGLPGGTREILQAAAIMGREFEFGLLQCVTGQTESQLLTALRSAISAGLVEEWIPSSTKTAPPAPICSGGDDRFRFRHALTRDVIEGDLLMRERRLIHGRIADEIEACLSARSGDDSCCNNTELRSLGPVAGRLARHLVLAGQPVRSRPYALAAAAWSRSAGGWSEAADYLDLALAATPTKSGEHLDLLEELGRLWRAQQDTVRAVSNLERAWREATALALFDRAAMIALELAIIQRSCDPAQARICLRTVHGQAEKCWESGRPTDAEAVRLFAGAALARYTAGALYDPDDAARWVDRARETAKELNDPVARADCLALLVRGMTRLRGRQRAEGIDEIERALAAARLSANPYLTALAGDTLIAALHAQGEDIRALRQFRAGVDDQPALQVAPAALYVFLTQGRWKDGMAAAQAAAAHCRRCGLQAALILVEVATAHLLIRMGHAELALQKLEPAWEYLRPRGDGDGILSCLWGMALAYTTLGRDHDAAATFHALHPYLSHTYDAATVVVPLLDGCSFFVRRGDHDTAARWLADLHRAARETGSPVADAAVAEAVGMVAVAENNSDRASAALEQAVEIWKTLSRPYYAARCQVALSEAMLVAPDVRASCRAEAATLLAEAEVAFHDLGAMADERAASDIRRKSGMISPARRRRTASSRHGTVGGLTAREHDVLELLVAGSTNREIASALFIAESTAELHVSRILGKLGCATRAQAAVYAVNQGWFAHPPLGLVAS